MILLVNVYIWQRTFQLASLVYAIYQTSELQKRLLAAYWLLALNGAEDIKQRSCSSNVKTKQSQIMDVNWLGMDQTGSSCLGWFHIPKGVNSQ